MKAIIAIKKGGNSILSVAPNNPEWGSIMVRNDETLLNERGQMQEVKKVGFINGPVETLKKLIETYNLKEGDDFSAKAFPVRIVIQETTKPLYDGHEAKVNPKTGAFVTSGGQHVYRSSIVVPETSTQVDSFLPNDRDETLAETSAFEETFTNRK